MRLNSLKKEEKYWTERNGASVPVEVISIDREQRRALLSVNGGPGEWWSSGQVQKRLRLGNAYGYQRVGDKLDTERVLDLMRSASPEQRYAELNGIQVKIYGERLATFLKGLSCVTCGLRGAYFSVDRSGSGSIHLNLYATDAQGMEVLMTSDHIHPRSKGGSDHPDNRQSMCRPCNFKKGAEVPGQDQVQTLVVGLQKHNEQVGQWLEQEAE